MTSSRVTLPTVSRSFKSGRQSEQFYNDELTAIYESIRYLPHHKTLNQGELPPAAKINGAINAQPLEGVLNYWDESQKKWVPFFKKKFQIVDQMLEYYVPQDPVPGQLWIDAYGVMYFYDSRTGKWTPVKSIQLEDSQWSNAAFADFQIVSPLNHTGEYVVPIESNSLGKDKYVFSYSNYFTVTDPSVKTYELAKHYKSGQDELTIHINGILLRYDTHCDHILDENHVCTCDYFEVDDEGNHTIERGTVCNKIQFNVTLQTNDVVLYSIKRKMATEEIRALSATEQPLLNEDYFQYYLQNQIDYMNNDTTVSTDDGDKWKPDWMDPELDPPDPHLIQISPDQLTQYTIPNIKHDRIFIESDYDNEYTKVSSICIEYRTQDIIGKTVSAVHINPGRITRIIKRLVKVDKLNSTIAVSPINTEFYGYCVGDIGGSFLRPSMSQDNGDYQVVDNHIVLNYYANQHYDYILAITYEFTWMRSDGSMARSKPSDINNTFYLANFKTPINVHVNGLKVEEASYEVNGMDRTVTFEDDLNNASSVALWSPYKKQFGYIRETDLEGRGIIRLHERVRVPLVFVGGTLIHPLYGGLVFSNDGQYIYVPNGGDRNQMRNMQWCVVDLVSDNIEVQYAQYGNPEETMAYMQNGPNDQLIGNDMYYDGTLSNSADSNGIYDYVLSSGTIGGVNGVVIRYDPNIIRPQDGILLFIDGLLIDEKDIERDSAEGIIIIRGGLSEEQEYVLLKDQEGTFYNSTNVAPAFGTGYFSESLIYMNGKLLCNSNCVTTISTPEEKVIDGAVDKEICFFIENDQHPEDGIWKIYDQFHNKWDTLIPSEKAKVEYITGSYENSLTSIRFNIDYTEDDNIDIYTFKFASDLSGLTSIGTATYWKDDEDDGIPIFSIGADSYKYNMGMLNVYRNGVKLVEGRDFEEMAMGKHFRMLTDFEPTDNIQYVIETVEYGYDKGHTFVTLSRDNAIQPNIYKIPDDANTLLYPGRLTVYVNGIRIPHDDWALVSTSSILLKYSDYTMSGSDNNYPTEELVDSEDYRIHRVTHEFPDEIMVEIRYDYTRQEQTVILPPGLPLNELSIEDFEINRDVLYTTDEVLFYLNGQFLGLSRNKNSDYHLDRYKGCIAFFEPNFLEAVSRDELKILFDQNNAIYTAWKNMTGKTSYVPEKTNALTIVWR